MTSAQNASKVAYVRTTYVNNVMTGSYIYISGDEGSNFYQSATGGNHAWNALAYSQDGTELVAASQSDTASSSPNQGSIYISKDNGNSWAKTNASPGRWAGLFVSPADNKKIWAETQAYSSAVPVIYLSTDGGNSWSVQGSAVMPLAGSSDGTRLLGVGYYKQNFYMYLSTDGGQIWNKLSFSTGFIDPTLDMALVSLDGNKMAVVAEGQLYTSTDGGVTWAMQDVPLAIGALAATADLSKIYIEVETWSGDGIISYQAYVLSDQNDFGHPSGDYSATGITSTQTYTLSCTQGGTVLSASATVSASTQAMPAGVTFSASRARPGGPATVKWTVTGMGTGISCNILPALSSLPASGLVNSLWNGTDPNWSASATTSNISKPTSYTLTCGNGTASTSQSTNVLLVPNFQEI